MKKTKPQLTDEQKIAAAASSPMAKGLSETAGLLSLLRDKAGALMDPVKRVCYPPLAKAHEHAHRHALRVSDPIHRICYEPLKGHWERKYKARYPKHAGKLFSVDLVLMAVVAALLVAGVYAPEFMTTPTPSAVSASVRVPSPAVSGMPMDIAISYENLSAATIPCAVLTVDVPPEFSDADLAYRADELMGIPDGGCPMPAVVSPTEGGSSIPPHFTLHATLTGIPLAPAGSVISFPARISYWTVGATAPTVVPFHIRIPVDSTAPGVEIAVPDTILRGATTAITLSYSNDAPRTFTDAAVRFVPPADFVTTGSFPRADAKNLWRIGDLAADDAGVITVYGYLRSVRERVSSASFGAELIVDGGAGIRAGDEEGVPVVAAAARVNADSLSTGLTLVQDLVGAAEARFLHPGDAVKVRLTVHNGGERTFEDAEIRLALVAALFEEDADMPTIWDATSVPALARIAPGEGVVLETTLRVRGEITPSLMDELGGIATASFATTLTAVAEGDAERLIVDTPSRDIPVATALSIQAASVYFTKEGDQLGRGPLPPMVGETTRYRIVVQIDNAQNAVDGTVFEAFLPDDVEWTGKFSVSDGEAIDYFPSTRRIAWKIPAIPAFTKEASRSPSASFEVALTPTKEAVGTIPMLLSGLSVEGHDTATDARVGAAHADLSARLPFDFDDARSVVVDAAKK